MKIIKALYNTFFISQLTVYCSVSNAQQHSIGFTNGYNPASFFNFSKDDSYTAKYHTKSGFSVSSFYETKIDSTTNFKVELQYRFQNADMEIDYGFGHSSFYKNLDYSFHLLNLNLVYVFNIVDRKAFKINILFGPTFSYTVNTLAKGNGWDYRLVTQIDTLGNPISVITTQPWEKNERNSKDLSMFNVGVDLGFDFLIPVHHRLDFLIQNKYNLFISSVSKMKNTRHTSLFTGSLQVGLRYQLKK